SIHVTIPLDQLLPVNSAAGGGASGTGEHASNSADRGNAADEAWTPVNPDKHLDESQIPELAGYGPISPAVARALAAGGDWRRIVTDPLTGAVLDVGHTRYRPTQAIADHVRARDRMCVRPGCGHRAHDCELDVVPTEVGYAAGWWVALQRGVAAVMIIGVEEGGELCEALGFAGVGARVGPFLFQGAVEPLD